MNKQNFPFSSFYILRIMLLPLIVSIGILLSSCAFYSLRRDLKDYGASFALAGQVNKAGSSNNGPIVVMLYKKGDKGTTISQYLVADPSKHYSFIVGKGQYYISAFEDLNRNLTYDEGESLGFYGKPTEIIVAAKNLKTKGARSFKYLDIEMTKANKYPDEMPRAITEASFAAKSFARIAIIKSLDDKIFHPKKGSLGMWKPFSFIKEIGVGIYFLEPYDPDKIPVLFVHGSGGTPLSWKPIVERLDRQKFQPWFYYYPSGFRLDAIARTLNTLIKELHKKYDFNKLSVVAHSMGGLVSRAFIERNVIEDQHHYIDKFISISTPWGGVKAAEIGVNNAPASIPNWHDLSPDSDFLKYIYKYKIPDEIGFYLIFGVRGSFSMMMGNNDGVVEIASEIFQPAQSDAEGFYGFNETHTSILTSDEVIVLLLELINHNRY